MSNENPSSRVKHDHVFASYEAAVAWMDDHSDDDSDDRDEEIPKSCPAALNITKHPNGSLYDASPSRPRIPSLSQSEDNGFNEENSESEVETPQTTCPTVLQRVSALKESYKNGLADYVPLPQHAPPAVSQSYFDQFTDFRPNTKAGFEDEFKRCMSSQGIAHASQEYRRRRTAAISHELTILYSQPPQNDLSTIKEQYDDDDAVKKESSSLEDETKRLDLNCPKVKLVIYQNMCREVRLPPHNTIEACVRDLKTKVMVNIPDFIDARRKGIKVKLWDDFTEFSKYSMKDEHRIDRHEAKKNGRFLECLLRKIKWAARAPKTARCAASNSLSKRKFTTDDVQLLLKKRIRVDGVL